MFVLSTNYLFVVHLNLIAISKLYLPIFLYGLSFSYLSNNVDHTDFKICMLLEHQHASSAHGFFKVPPLLSSPQGF